MAFTQTTLSSAKAAASATTITTTVTAAVGDVLFAVCCWVPTSNGEVAVFSDTVNGTWSSFQGAGNSDLQLGLISIGFAMNPVEVTGTMTGTTVTATLPGGARTERIICVWKLPATDLTIPHANDTTGSSATGTSATAAPGAKTPTFNPDYEIFVVASDTSTVTTWSTPAGYTQLFAISGSSGLTQLGVFGLTSPTVSNTSTNPSSTSGAGSVKWVAGQYFYKAFVAAGTTHNSMLLGVGS